MITLISDKVDFRAKKIRDREGYCIIIGVNQENIPIVYIYIHLTTELRTCKAKTDRIKRI